MQISYMHNMWCGGYEPYKKRLDKEVAQGKKFKNRCNICGRKWVGTLKYEGVCKVCHKERKKVKEVPKKEEEKVLRHTM